MDKKELEKKRAEVMDLVPECEGLIAADVNGKVIIGQTITDMNHDVTNKAINYDEANLDINNSNEANLTINVQKNNEWMFDYHDFFNIKYQHHVFNHMSDDIVSVKKGFDYWTI